MAITGADGPSSVIDIPAEYDLARRYIVAIVARDRRAALDTSYSRRLTTALWNRFFAEYLVVSSGAYAPRSGCGPDRPLAHVMVPLPRACSNCRADFEEADPQRRLALLENGGALCSACAWFVDHADGEGERRDVARRRPRSWDPFPV